MGSCAGGFTPNTMRPGQGKNLLPMCRDLGYSRSDIDSMYRSFKEMDVYNNGIVSVRAYCAIYKLSDAFGNVIFRKMLGSGTQDSMNFSEYLLSSWNALSFFDEHSLAIFTFQIFDTDGSGIMSPKEVFDMVHVIWGNHTNHNTQLVHALNSHMGKGHSVDLKGFIILSKNFPILLFPIFDLLRNARCRTLGERRWKTLSHRRKATAGNGTPTHFGNLKHISLKGRMKKVRQATGDDFTAVNITVRQ